MVNIKEVFWTATAKDDLHKIYLRTAINSQEQARKNLDMVVAKTASLSQQYNTGTVEPLLRNEKIPHYFIIVGFYKIIYSVEVLEVYIKSIYHTRENPQ